MALSSNIIVSLLRWRKTVNNLETDIRNLKDQLSQTLQNSTHSETENELEFKNLLESLLQSPVPVINLLGSEQPCGPLPETKECEEKSFLTEVYDVAIKVENEEEISNNSDHDGFSFETEAEDMDSDSGFPVIIPEACEKVKKEVPEDFELSSDTNSANDEEWVVPLVRRRQSARNEVKRNIFKPKNRADCSKSMDLDVILQSLQFAAGWPPELHSDSSGSFSCPFPFCAKRSKYKKQIILHAEKDHAKLIVQITEKFGHRTEIHKCKRCSKTFPTSRKLYHQRLRHKEEKQFSCPQCQSTFKLKGEVNRHMSDVHSGKEYPCSSCNRKYKSSSSLAYNITLSHPPEGKTKPSFLCSDCGAVLSSSTGLKHHVETVQLNIKPFECPFANCGKAFGKKGTLERHMKTNIHTEMDKTKRKK